MVTKIRHQYTGHSIYECDCETMKECVEIAVKQHVSLIGANLYGANLSSANLYGIDLRYANLSGADLSYANLSLANFCFVNLYSANLSGANLSGANLYGANLSGANLSDANLSSANLYSANLKGVNLQDADLRYANLYSANLSGAKNVPYIPLVCPSDGAFIGWKKIGDYIVKLHIPEDARRSSATTNKCRCDKAMVLEITGLYETKLIKEIENTNCTKTTYKVGEMVYPDSFDENRWNECSHGIHFFINKQDAINY